MDIKFGLLASNKEESSARQLKRKSSYCYDGCSGEKKQHSTNWGEVNWAIYSFSPSAAGRFQSVIA